MIVLETFWPITWPNINIFNETKFIRLVLSMIIFRACISSIYRLMWILWPKYTKKCTKLTISLENCAEIFYGNSGDYYLSIGVKKSRFWALFTIFDFLGPTIRSLGPQNPTKKLTHSVELLGYLLSRNHVSKFSDLGPPPPLKLNLNEILYISRM